MSEKKKCNIKRKKLLNVTQISRKHCSSRNTLRPDEGVSSHLYLSWSSYPSAGYITAIFVMGLSYSPVRVLTFTFLTFPSFPGYTLTTRPTFHVPRIALEVCTITKSSTRTLRFSACHCFLGRSAGKTSLVQRVQKESNILWTNSTLCLGFLVCLNGPCGTVDYALPSNISLGQRYEPSSGSLEIRPIGR